MDNKRDELSPVTENGLTELLPEENTEEPEAEAEQEIAGPAGDGPAEPSEDPAKPLEVSSESSESHDESVVQDNKEEAETGAGEKKVPLMPEWFPKQKEGRAKEASAEGAAPERPAFLKASWWTSARIIAAVVIAALLLASAAGIATYRRHAAFYADHFFEGTRINGMDVSGMTAEEVEQTIREKAEDYSLKLTFRDGKTETLSSEDLGYTYVSDGTVQDLLDSQDEMRWYFANGEEKENVPVETAVTFSEEAVRKSLEGLDELQPDKMEAPRDAELLWDGDQYVVTQEVQGTTLDPEPVFTAVCSAADSGERTLDITAIEGIYKAPEVFSDDKELNREAKQLNELLTSDVTYDLPAGEKVLDGGTMKDWLLKDAEGNYYRDEEHWQEMIDSFIEELAEEVNTLERDRTFTSTESGTVTIIGNDYYGWEIDTLAEQNQLPEDLASEKPVEREPFYTSRELAKADDHDGIGPNYVEADLTAQHLWLYHDGEMIFDTDLVSGDMIDAKYTPEGVYPLMSKQEQALLVGASYGDGVYEYVTRVNYWMPFTHTGIGLHDATWRDAFGGDIYMVDGSHGCLNLPLEAAATIYKYVEKGTPIVVYYSDGNPLETRMTEAEKAEKDAEKAAKEAEEAAKQETPYQEGDSYEYIYEGTEEEFYQQYGDGSYGEIYAQTHTDTSAAPAASGYDTTAYGTSYDYSYGY